jgi:hypothetical protein
MTGLRDEINNASNDAVLGRMTDSLPVWADVRVSRRDHPRAQAQHETPRRSADFLELSQWVLHATFEPCLMCRGAIIASSRPDARGRRQGRSWVSPAMG